MTGWAAAKQTETEHGGAREERRVKRGSAGVQIADPVPSLSTSMTSNNDPFKDCAVDHGARPSIF